MTISTEATEPGTITQETENKNHERLAAKSYLVPAALILALIAIGCAFFAIYLSLQLQENAAQKQAVAREIQNLINENAENAQQIKLDLNASKVSNQTLEENYVKLNNSVQSTLQQRSYQTSDWMLMKARYYLELAQINTHWSNDSATTIALLEQGDHLLAELSDQRLFQVRQAIANEILAIKSLPKRDTAGLLSQLDAVGQLIPQLPLKAVNTSINSESSTTQHSSTWKNRLQESMRQLKQLVVIRHHTEAIEPLIGVDQEAILRENLRLNVEEIQWAILQNNDKIYQLLLKQALHKIPRYFQVQAESTQSLMKQLKTLQDIHLEQQKPMLDQSLLLLNQIIETKQGISPPKTGENS